MSMITDNTLGLIIKTNIQDYPHLHLVDDKKASGFPNELNIFQFESFIQFKQICINEKLIPNFDYYDDYYLLKFCRARKFDKKKVVEMFKNFLDWRRKEKVDIIDSVFFFTERRDVKKVYPHGYHKVDKLGRPIYFELLSKIDLDALFKITTQDRLTKYYIQEYEHVMKYKFTACSKAMGKLVDQSFTILDLDGIGVSHFVGKTKDFVQLASKIGQDYYPENMGKMFLVNTNSFFTFVYSIVKTFLDPKTRDKIELKGKDYQNRLLEFVEPENLPTFFGGTCTCSHIEGGCLLSEIGPWNPEGGLPDAEEPL